jgi:hypothetical protein
MGREQRMRSYLNRADREHHLAILVFWDYLAAWLEKTTCLSPEERKRMKTVCTHLIRTSDSIVSRLEEDYAKKLARDVKDSQIRIVNETNRRMTGKEFVNVEIDDLFDIACYALTDCQDCKLSNWKECEKYRLYMKLNIPVAQEETAGCPYEN